MVQCTELVGNGTIHEAAGLCKEVRVYRKCRGKGITKRDLARYLCNMHAKAVVSHYKRRHGEPRKSEHTLPSKTSTKTSKRSVESTEPVEVAPKVLPTSIPVMEERLEDRTLPTPSTQKSQPSVESTKPVKVPPKVLTTSKSSDELQNAYATILDEVQVFVHAIEHQTDIRIPRKSPPSMCQVSKDTYNDWVLIPTSGKSNLKLYTVGSLPQCLVKTDNVRIDNNTSPSVRNDILCIKLNPMCVEFFVNRALQLTINPMDLNLNSVVRSEAGSQSLEVKRDAADGKNCIFTSCMNKAVIKWMNGDPIKMDLGSLIQTFMNDKSVEEHVSAFDNTLCDAIIRYYKFKDAFQSAVTFYHTDHTMRNIFTSGEFSRDKQHIRLHLADFDKSQITIPCADSIAVNGKTYKPKNVCIMPFDDTGFLKQRFTAYSKMVQIRYVCNEAQMFQMYDARCLLADVLLMTAAFDQLDWSLVLPGKVSRPKHRRPKHLTRTINVLAKYAKVDENQLMQIRSNMRRLNTNMIPRGFPFSLWQRAKENKANITYDIDGLLDGVI